MTLRPARLDERALLEELQWRASLNNPGDRDALLQHPDAIALPSEQLEAGGVFVAEVDSRVMGFAAILPRDDGDSELDALFVEPEAWRHGIGRALVDHCVSEAKRAGAGALHVVGNPHAEAFYRRCGFTTVGTTDTRFGVGLLMRRQVQ